MTDGPRYLIIDGYTKAGRDQLAAGGAAIAADLYQAMIEKLSPGARCEIVFPSDPGAALPQGAAIADGDAIAWTGCSLSLLDDTPQIRAQVEFARQAFAAGIPSFGSCWAAQVAVVAAGGEVRVNPKGREMGFARKITLTPDGQDHPMYSGKAPVFDAFISHDDEISVLPEGAMLLAHNDFTRVQSVSVTHQGGTFWGLQYHPEYDLHEMARLIFCRTDKLIKLGFFRDRQGVLDHVRSLEDLHADPKRTDIAWRLGIDGDVMDENIRRLEVRNWIERLVLPTMGG